MHRTSTNGSYRLDRVFPGVGRIAVASGATTAAEFASRNELLTRLFNKGRLDLLRAIQARTYSPTEVYAADLEGRLNQLTAERAVLARPLWATVETWVGPTPGPTRKRYQTSFNALRVRGGLPEGATIEALAAVDWKALKARWPKTGADWNHLRRAVSHFLSDQLGDTHHPWRRAIVKAENFPKAAEVERVPDVSPELFWRIVRAAPEHVRPAFVAIAALGLRVGEYLRLRDTDLLPHTLQVRIPGTKTAGSAATLKVDERLWPWIKAAVPAPVRYKWLRTYWIRARDVAEAGDVRLHDLRHACGQWLVDAGRPEASVQTTLRHATAAMTRRYTKQRDRGENAKTMADVMLVRTA
jgi:integrase